MGDQDDGFALFAQAAKNAEELIGFGRGQHARGFVQDQDIGLTVERFKDFDALQHAHAEVFDDGIGVDLQAIFCLKLFEAFARFGQRRAQKPTLFCAQNDVFQYGEILHQFEMLEDHADPGGDSGLAVRDVGLFAGDKDLPRVGFVKTVEDAHQRGFARTVFTDDPVDRAGGDADGDVLVGLNRAKGFGDAFEFNCWSGHAHCPWAQGPDFSKNLGRAGWLTARPKSTWQS